MLLLSFRHGVVISKNASFAMGELVLMLRYVNRFARSKIIIVITGIVMIALGIAIFVNPIAAVQTLVRIIGWILAGYGVITLVSAFSRGDPVHNAPSELALGAACLVFGLVMGIAPAVFVQVVWTIIGCIVLATGVLDIIEAGDARSVHSPLAMPATISGVITCLLGAVAIFMPFLYSELAMLVAAVVLLIDGVTEVIFGLGV